MSIEYGLIAIFLMALITYVPRSLPLLLVKTHLKSKKLQTFLKYMPYAVLGALTFPNVFNSSHSVVASTVGVISATIAAYFKRGLLTVTIIAVSAVWIVERML